MATWTMHIVFFHGPESERLKDVPTVMRATHEGPADAFLNPNSELDMIKFGPLVDQHRATVEAAIIDLNLGNCFNCGSVPTRMENQFHPVHVRYENNMAIGVEVILLCGSIDCSSWSAMHTAIKARTTWARNSSDLQVVKAALGDGRDGAVLVATLTQPIHLVTPLLSGCLLLLKAFLDANDKHGTGAKNSWMVAHVQTSVVLGRLITALEVDHDTAPAPAGVLAAAAAAATAVTAVAAAIAGELKNEDKDEEEEMDKNDMAEEDMEEENTDKEDTDEEDTDEEDADEEDTDEEDADEEDTDEEDMEEKEMNEGQVEEQEGSDGEDEMELCEGEQELPCAVCNSLENVQKCADCLAVGYCSFAHQRQDWEAHQKTCGK